MTPLRCQRLESLLLELIARMLLNGEVKDHRVSSDMLIRAVTVARDFSAARIYVSSFRENQVEKAVQALNHAAGFIRHRIAPKLHTRFIPVLTFYADYSLKLGDELRLKMAQDLSCEHDDKER